MYPAPDQKAIRIARLLGDEILPKFGVPEALLSDRGTNMLANVMQDVCHLYGITKLNTTAYHPQCDGMVEYFKQDIQDHAPEACCSLITNGIATVPARAYINTSHETTKEKPSYCTFCMAMTADLLLKLTFFLWRHMVTWVLWSTENLFFL